jgi:hypothetical protein
MTQKNDFKLTVELRKRALRLIAAQITMFLLNYVSLLLLKAHVPNVTIWPWTGGIIIFAVAELVNLCLFLFAPWIHRAIYYRLFFFLGGVFPSLLYAFLSATRFADVLFEGVPFYLLVGANLIFILYHYAPSNITQKVIAYKRAEKYNIKSGKLTKDGNWDITIALLDRSPEEQEHRKVLARRLMRWTQLVPGIAFFLSRTLTSSNLILFFCVVLYWVAHVLASASANVLSVMIYLIELEKEMGKSIGLVSKKTDGFTLKSLYK